METVSTAIGIRAYDYMPFGFKPHILRKRNRPTHLIKGWEAISLSKIYHACKLGAKCPHHRKDFVALLMEMEGKPETDDCIFHTPLPKTEDLPNEATDAQLAILLRA